VKNKNGIRVYKKTRSSGDTSDHSLYRVSRERGEKTKKKLKYFI